MVGFRVFDVGLLIVWLVWFFRLRDDDDSSEDEGPGGGGGPPLSPDRGPGGGGMRLPLGRARQAGLRMRDHPRPGTTPRRRGAETLPRTVPARVRQPHTPVPAHRRA
ncbi:MAG: hypothetical protein QOG86_166 [Thermoleophilaceae bacterium]|nr:hypothetical protein [Thermoleophilaceae bacterium]